ncbi:MAG: tetratricopeptide repeat protein [Flavobacteriales bacterium]|nr:tetratricopeptide repeat protein [Flavobacteriales bacterium]
MEYYFKALKMAEEMGDKNKIATDLGNIGSLYTQTGRFEEAEVYLDSALAVSERIGALLLIKGHHQNLSSLYDTTARYQLALEHYKKYSAAKDSLFNEEKSKDLGKLEARHEFETAEAERKRVEQEEAKQAAATKSRRDNLQYSGILIMQVLVFAGVFMLGRFSIPVRLAGGMIFFAFLLFFEFMLVMLDPYIENYSGGEPAYKLLFNAVLAGLIFPLHSLFESKMKGRLVKAV